MSDPPASPFSPASPPPSASAAPQRTGNPAPPQPRGLRCDAVRLKQCEDLRDDIMKNNIFVKFMLNALDKAGCPIRREQVQCVCCDGQVLGGLQSDGNIVVCANQMVAKYIMSSTLQHEMVHAFDACRAHVDWGNCVHHACTEIRASALSGDCNFMREVTRGNIGIGGQFQQCVRRRAELSVKMNPNCSPNAAQEAVSKAWDSCFNDTSPYDRHPP